MHVMMQSTLNDSSILHLAELGPFQQHNWLIHNDVLMSTKLGLCFLLLCHRLTVAFIEAPVLQLSSHCCAPKQQPLTVKAVRKLWIAM